MCYVRVLHEHDLCSVFEQEKYFQILKCKQYKEDSGKIKQRN